MEADARAAAKTYKLLKCKLTGEDDRERVAAVRRGAPEARLVVDANESWDDLDIEAEAHALSAFGVELIEQPVSAGEEDLLIGLQSPIPFCADESCPTNEDLDRLEGSQAVNIQLDKDGGLTEAKRLADKATGRGRDVVIGWKRGHAWGMAR